MSGVFVGQISGPKHDVQVKVVNILLHTVPKHVQVIQVGLLQLLQKIHSNSRPELGFTGALGGEIIEMFSKKFKPWRTPGSTDGLGRSASSGWP